MHKPLVLLFLIFLAEQRSKLVEDFRKEETAEELENTKKLIEELKTSLEKIEKDELQAKEEAERVILKIEEMEQDIVSEASIEAKAQLEAEKAMLTEALSEFEFVKREPTSLLLVLILVTQKPPSIC